MDGQTEPDTFSIQQLPPPPTEAIIFCDNPAAANF
eukprot:CAMPEP_0178428704 /NCGR_PEP_ID=MMETSP0689_2-20121128/30418_1 /TAXON_ID=160604 /ORGANISM="Amphidinium massartii, Strain CS-259" /LENGTH=34 /DNA_ID= /DNA_START= /DNA_END= /DNA_ORIENTATION=